MKKFILLSLFLMTLSSGALAHNHSGHNSYNGHNSETTYFSGSVTHNRPSRHSSGYGDYYSGYSNYQHRPNRHNSYGHGYSNSYDDTGLILSAGLLGYIIGSH